MISIDRISFEFAMNDESFAQGLCAAWDSFCYPCVENIVEDCLSEYDKDRVLHQIEILDIDLRSILQEDFYSEFPKRLREELLKALSHLQIGHTYNEDVKTTASRFVNLLHYLEHGMLKTEWADIDFDLSQELDVVTRQDKRYLEKIAGLCMANEHALRRLLLQTDHDVLLVRLYSTAMDSMLSVLHGKHRFMEIFLEMHPDVLLRFVHGTEEDGRLHGMAELLDTRSVRKVMEKETAEHAEVDLPPYWHYLYEWLIKYYPFNGIAIFGGKSDFIGHLHYRLLTFIRKRNNTSYLSKTELTATFLLEVFGTAYYKEVLNAIYNMQPRNSDGSPAHDGYYNRELYRIFMQLSLLYLPRDMYDHADETVYKEKTASLLTSFRIKDLSAVLKDVGRNDVDKRMVIATLVQQKPEDFISWLKTEATDAATLITILASLIDVRILKQLFVSISLVAMETVDEVIRYLTGLVREETKSPALKIQVLACPLMELFSFLLTALFGKENASVVIRLMLNGTTGEITTDEKQDDDILKAMELLPYTDSSRVRLVMSVFEQWLQHVRAYSNTVQTLVREKPQELTMILRNLSQGERTVSLMATYLPTEVLLDVVEKVDPKQALLLSRTIDLLQRERGRFSFLSNMILSFTTALSEALLLFMKDNDTLAERNLTEQEVIGKFLAHLYYVYTKRTDYNDNKEWKHLQDEVTNGVGLDGTDTTSATVPEDAISERLLFEYGSLNDSELYHQIVQALEKQSEVFVELSGKNLDTEFIRCISDIADRTILRRMVTILSSVCGLEDRTAVIRLMEWLGWIASLSLSLEEPLRQITKFLLSKGELMNETALKQGLLTFMATNDATRFTYYINKGEVADSFLLLLPVIQERTKKEKMKDQLMKNLGLTPEEERMLESSQEKNREIAFVSNAGLCLLSPWFLRLFGMLGYLDEEKRNFKDTASRIRAVFLLQYLVSPEEKGYHEPELTFNRLLVALPAQVPLPKQIELTDKEKQTVDSLLKGVKDNWTKMSNTSASGFRQSFIMRNGQLEQQDEKWLLTVESHAYDMLLDSVPWAFRQIRYPWLKKYIQVLWHERQEF